MTYNYKAELTNYRLFAPKTIRSQELNTFAPWNFCTLELSLFGTFALWNFRCVNLAVDRLDAVELWNAPSV